jgi:hypothetical protein
MKTGELNYRPGLLEVGQTYSFVSPKSPVAPISPGISENMKMRLWDLSWDNQQ